CPAAEDATDNEIPRAKTDTLRDLDSGVGGFPGHRAGQNLRLLRQRDDGFSDAPNVTALSARGRAVSIWKERLLAKMSRAVLGPSERSHRPARKLQSKQQESRRKLRIDLQQLFLCRARGRLR